MPAWTVPLADVAVTEEDITAVAATYRSGWLSMGPATESLERDLAAFTSAAEAIAVSSGTGALHLACLAAGLVPGDEAIVPSLTFVATVNAIAYTGAAPVFAEIAGLDRPWLSAAAAEAAITPRTRAIMAMAYGGHPGEIARLRELAERRGLVLLEDATHAIGARHAGRHVGTFGLSGSFSFFANKNLAVGEGGAVVTDNPAVAERVRLMRSHGMTTRSWDRHRGHAANYDVVGLGFNYRIDEPRATLAARRLATLNAENARRHKLDRRYRGALAGLDGVTPTLAPPSGPVEVPAHHLFTVTLDPGVDRDAVRRAMAERGVQTSVHYPPAHRFALYASTAPRLPVTDEFSTRAVTLPMFAHMTDAQQDVVLAALADALRDALGRPTGSIARGS